MPTLAETLKAAADAAQAAMTADETAEVEPRTIITDALNTAATQGKFARLFPAPTDDPPLVLTKQEANWFTNQSGCKVTHNPDGSVLVTFAQPKPILP